MSIIILDYVKEQLTRTARSHRNEIIGVAMGRDLGKDIIINRLEMPSKFESSAARAMMKSEQILEIEKYREEGEHMVALVHSHLGGVHYSSIDEEAFKAWKYGLIVSASTGEIKAYKYDGTVKEISLHVMSTTPFSYRKMFDRHFRAIGNDQLKLRKSSVGIIGVGAVGSIVAMELAGAGVGKLSLVDHDKIEIHNVPRFFPGLVQPEGYKVEATKRFLKFPHLKVETHARRVEDLPDDFFREQDVIVSATDDMGSRMWIQEMCLEFGKTLVDAGIKKETIRVAVFKPRGGVCLACNPLQSERGTPITEITPKFALDLKKMGIYTVEKLRSFDRKTLLKKFGRSILEIIDRARRGCTARISPGQEPDPSLSWSTHLAGEFAAIQVINHLLGYPTIKNTFIFDCHTFGYGTVEMRGNPNCPVKKRVPNKH